MFIFLFIYSFCFIGRLPRVVGESVFFLSREECNAGMEIVRVFAGSVFWDALARDFFASSDMVLVNVTVDVIYGGAFVLRSTSGNKRYVRV